MRIQSFLSYVNMGFNGHFREADCPWCSPMRGSASRPEMARNSSRSLRDGVSTARQAGLGASFGVVREEDKTAGMDDRSS
jgi:hypothetical protein